MICKNCNTEISDDSEFCINCGARISEDTEISEYKQTEVKLGEKFIRNNYLKIGIPIIVVGLILCAILICFLIKDNGYEDAISTESEEKQVEQNNSDGDSYELSSDELESLEKTLATSYTVCFDDSMFDSRELSFEDLVLIYMPYYFNHNNSGEIESISGTNPDPKNMFVSPMGDGSNSYSYYKLKADTVDKISKTIYNIEPDRNVETDSVYYYDGYYYLSDAGDPPVSFFCEYYPKIMNYKAYKDDKYYISVEYGVTDSDGQPSDWVEDEKLINHLIVELKNNSGEEQWSIIKAEKSEFNVEADYGEVLAYKEINQIDYGYYKNVEEEKKAKEEEYREQRASSNISSSRNYTDEQVMNVLKKRIENSVSFVQSYKGGFLTIECYPTSCSYDESSHTYTVTADAKVNSTYLYGSETVTVNGVYKETNQGLKEVSIDNSAIRDVVREIERARALS